MDKLGQYRNIIQKVLLAYSRQYPTEGNCTVRTIADAEADVYRILYVSHQPDCLSHHCVLHIDIRDGKVCIQWTSAQRDMRSVLVAAGIPPEEIVVGFHSPQMQQLR